MSFILAYPYFNFIFYTYNKKNSLRGERKRKKKEIIKGGGQDLKFNKINKSLQ